MTPDPDALRSALVEALIEHRVACYADGSDSHPADNTVIGERPDVDCADAILAHPAVAAALVRAVLAATPTASPTDRLRDKYAIPRQGSMETEYWRGYAEALDEVDGFTASPTAGGLCEYDCDACREAAEMSRAAIPEQDESGS